jgi:hypothetical protein
LVQQPSFGHVTLLTKMPISQFLKKEIHHESQTANLICGASSKAFSKKVEELLFGFCGSFLAVLVDGDWGLGGIGTA